MKRLTLVATLAILTLSIGVSCMLNHAQRTELDLQRFRHQDQLLPPSFLAKIVRVHPRPEGTFGIGYLYTVFDVQPIDEAKNPIPSLELRAVQAAITPYQPIPDFLYGNPARETGQGLDGETAASPETGQMHSHSSVSLGHSHQVFTEADRDAWRNNFLAGDDGIDEYLAIVNSVAAGQDIYYFVVGFALDRDVLPATTLPEQILLAPLQEVFPTTLLSDTSILISGQDFNYRGPELEISARYRRVLSTELRMSEGSSVKLAITDNATGREVYFGIVDFLSVGLQPQGGSLEFLAEAGKSYTFTATRSISSQ